MILLTAIPLATHINIDTYRLSTIIIFHPLVRGSRVAADSLITSFTLVFLESLKELPATLILRPLNFDTLAVKGFELASDERLADAAPAVITIVIVGLVPLTLLNRSISQRYNTNNA